MSKKEKFIELVQLLMDREKFNFDDEEWKDALEFWKGLQISGDNGRPQFTDNGKLILQYMKDNEDSYNNFFKAKDIGEGLSISSRTVSGAMRKLINDGYVEKMGADPTVYAITSLGEEVNLT